MILSTRSMCAVVLLAVAAAAQIGGSGGNHPQQACDGSEHGGTLTSTRHCVSGFADPEDAKDAAMIGIGGAPSCGPCPGMACIGDFAVEGGVFGGSPVYDPLTHTWSSCFFAPANAAFTMTCACEE